MLTLIRSKLQLGSKPPASLSEQLAKFLHQQVVSRYSEQGLTLMETIVAMLILSTVVAISTPPILLATATRVQNRRAEQAMQLAQQEIERVRLIVDRGQYENSCPADDDDNDCLPPAAANITAPDDIKDVGAPTTTCDPPSDPDFSCTATQAFPNTEGDFFIQVFRDPGVTLAGVGPGGADQVVAFRMGVRVYSNAAAAELDSDGNLETTPATLQMTSAEGRQRRFPLAVLYADFTRGDLTGTLDSYREFLTR